MEMKLNSPVLGGKIKAISSKSMAHRLLICAAFAEREVDIVCEDTNADISATAECLNALGAKVTRTGDLYQVTPITRVNTGAVLDCGESGSTLRFLLPIASAIGANASFVMHGRLPQRPLSPMFEELKRGGMSMSKEGSNPLLTSGSLAHGDFSIAANISSQFVSGLMFALPLIYRYQGVSDSSLKSTLTLTGEIESAPYIEMTLDALAQFGVTFDRLNENGGKDVKYSIPASMEFRAPKDLRVEGDWSNAAFWLCAGAIGKSPVTVTSLNLNSRQGDMKILDLLENFGAEIFVSDNEITVARRHLHGISIDATQIPDLVPILAVVASVSEGETVIHGASRLRIKESDRIRSVTNMLSALGADIKETADGLIINGNPRLNGGYVHAENDHRIAMAAAVASTVCDSEVTVNDAQAVSKSYPHFWEDFEKLSKGNS
jgi:3-phosphoshikimate 1-carboxyvinyltransferase